MKSIFNQLVIKFITYIILFFFSIKNCTGFNTVHVQSVIINIILLILALAAGAGIQPNNLLPIEPQVGDDELGGE